MNAHPIPPSLQGLTLRERFHRMAGADPLWYTFQAIWSRVWIDKSIGHGLCLVDYRAEMSE